MHPSQAVSPITAEVRANTYIDHYAVVRYERVVPPEVEHVYQIVRSQVRL